MLTIRTNVAFTDPSLPVLTRDRLLLDDNGGVRHLFDLAYPFSWPGGVPVNGAVIRDVAENADGAFTLTGTGTVAAAGGGFDFTNVTTPVAEITIPAAVSTDIWGDGVVNQYFLQCLYMRLPTLAGWSVSGVPAMTSFTSAATGFQAENEMFGFHQATSGGTPRVRGLRCLNGTASLDEFNIEPTAGHYGSVVQLAFWRDASGQVMRLKSANGSILTGKAVNVNNAVSFAGKAGHIGIGAARWPPVTTGRGFRVYRGFVENLRTSGRNPAAVLDADWARTIARGVFT